MTKTTTDADHAVSRRSGIVENTHQVHAAVVDSTGRLLFSLGNPRRVTLVRSAAKPAQAVAVIETGALERYGFDEADLALMCASHNSEERHAALARAMLEKAGAREEDLKCGGHPSIWPALNLRWAAARSEPSPVYSNCSGKHAGMIAGGRALGHSIEDYHLPRHEIQGRVRAVIQDLTDLGCDDIEWGLDGCNMPAPAFPLLHLAILNSRFAQAVDRVADAGGHVESLSSRTRHMARVFNAMARYPENVGGHERFCTVLMETYDGALIGKVGADGSYGVAVRESPDTRRLGAEGAVGIAVKVEDGSVDVVNAVVCEVLEQLQIGSAVARARLGKFHHFEFRNTRGVVTGELEFPFKLRVRAG